MRRCRRPRRIYRGPTNAAAEREFSTRFTKAGSNVVDSAAIPIEFLASPRLASAGELAKRVRRPTLMRTVPHRRRAADTIVLAGWPTRDRRPREKLLRAIIRAHERGARIVGICSGAFLLAATGLLEGRQATTHWRMAADLARTYPLVAVDADVLYIDHGDAATSAGTGAAIDLCLHLVRRDFGAAYVDEVSRHMVVSPHREGGQRQYARISDPTPARTLGPTLDWAMQRLDQYTLADLADHAGPSSRTIAREFDRAMPCR